MYEKLNVVKIGGHNLPIRCDIRVLSALQEEFGTTVAFQQKLIGMEKVSGSDESIFTEPNIHAIEFALKQMIPEGIRKAEEQDEEVPDVDWKQLIENFDFEYIEVALALHNEFQRCFNRKKKTNSKDTRPSQKQTKSTSKE